MAPFTERPTVVLAVSGSIAAYKAVMVARLLVKAGVRVRPIMTEAAKRFLGPLTLAGICGEPAASEMFVAAGGEPHVELAESADVFAVVPATADVIAGLAQGRADDLVRATALCARGPVLLAPAMHPRMWSHPATRANVALLEARGVELVGPDDGEVASGDFGIGRMAEPEAIAEAILARCGGEAERDLEGVRMVVTAGPTVEDLDPARYLSNRSSGKMGFAVAARAAARGAEVVLVAGPVALDTPPGVTRIDVRSALDMKVALWEALGPEDLDRADVLVMTAAVADYRAAAPSEAKLKRQELGSKTQISLVANPDLLAEVGAAREGDRPLLVGFALETVEPDALVAAGRVKLEKKGVDVVVANRAADAFDKDDNRVTIVTEDTAEVLDRAPKTVIADRLLDRVAAMLGASS
ncbi:MAG: bifunctional phosphopantothenoylcysteine decarboxylase/phosphopantothenate--cysteine ligase CoaBC [Polyangiaceae bacterium]